MPASLHDQLYFHAAQEDYPVNVCNVLVEICEEQKLKMIHFSTDYVYNSESLDPIKEGKNVDPINYYGYSKREGEKFIEDSSSESIIIRTSWLYSNYKNNFVKTIINKGNNNESGAWKPQKGQSK